MLKIKTGEAINSSGIKVCNRNMVDITIKIIAVVINLISGFGLFVSRKSITIPAIAIMSAVLVKDGVNKNCASKTKKAIRKTTKASNVFFPESKIFRRTKQEKK
ncbi:MAG TPA: hypothetical protein VKT28_00170 [Puia sp.]|nr:hypothetical protein [Puia sp.]